MRKGEVIRNLIELNRFRKYARILGTKSVKRAHVSPDELARFATEIDNCFACIAAAIKALMAPARPK